MPNETTHDISIRGTTHKALKQFCVAQGISLRAAVEAWVHEFAPFTGRKPRQLPRNEKGCFVEPEPEPHPIDPEPVDREPEIEVKGSDIVEPSSEGLIPFEKRAVRGGGYNEF